MQLYQYLDKIWLCSVGYDARLCIWDIHARLQDSLTQTRISDSAFNIFKSINSFDLKIKHRNNDEIADSVNYKNPLAWLTGSVCNIGDIGGLAINITQISNILQIAVTGEGLQSFKVNMDDLIKNYY
jgi:hypothetical protein